MLKVTPLTLPGLSLLTPTIHGDSRGFLVELFHVPELAAQGIDFKLVRHVRSRSKKGVVRGLHFQWAPPLGKIVRVARGRAFVVAADIRKNSPTRGKWEGRELTEESKEAMHLPFGFGSGFCALEDDTEIEYYMSDIYDPSGESNIIWNDTTIKIDWPVREADALVSERDKNAQTFESWLARSESDLIR